MAHAARSIASLSGTLLRSPTRQLHTLYNRPLHHVAALSQSGLVDTARCAPRPHAFSSRAMATAPQTEKSKPSDTAAPDGLPASPRPRSMTRDIREHADQIKKGAAANHDLALIAPAHAKTFPRIKTTSLSTKRIVIHDEASAIPVTLVMVAFRSFADDQLRPWRDAFSTAFVNDSKWFDVTVNESFGSQALSGFVQRWQRGRTEIALHDFYVAFNSRAREPLESLMLTTNRMFGNVLLLDRQARVRFRASGQPSVEGIDALLACARQLIDDDKGPTQKQPAAK